jgi:hypothetical protein
MANAPAAQDWVMKRDPPNARVTAKTNIARRRATAVETIKIPSPEAKAGRI